ncbi:MAG TPA: class I SAM-dependent methyltransferase, partial [Rhodocyclaceae bacterium]|nr:class I SAM-dependent methyltransferase [Rhodocyclaceae bacterium]
MRWPALSAVLLFAVALLAFSDGQGVVRSAGAQSPRLDVHYVPTPHEVVQRMLEMVEVQPDDYVVDLGSGDGRIVIAAVRDWNVQRALGIDLDPERVAEARENAREAGVADRAVFEEGNIFEKDFFDATVVTMYLLSSINLRLQPIILERMAPGTRIVSHAFDMGEWEADQHDSLDGRNVYMWIVPARVEGRWQLRTSNGNETTLSIEQTFQKIEGRAVAGGASIPLGDATLRGDEIAFSIGADRYVGKVEGDTIVPLPGTVQGWRA